MSTTPDSETATTQTLAAQLLTAMKTARGNETTFREAADKLLDGVSSTELCDALLGNPTPPDSVNDRSAFILQYVSDIIEVSFNPIKYLLTKLDSADTLRVLTSISHRSERDICPFYSPIALEQALSAIQCGEWQNRQNVGLSERANQDYENFMCRSRDLIASLLGNLNSADALNAATVPFIGETMRAHLAPEKGNNPLIFVIRERYDDILDIFLRKLENDDLFKALSTQNQRGELPLVIEIQHGVSDALQGHLLRLTIQQRNQLYHLKDKNGVSPSDLITREEEDLNRRLRVIGNIRTFFGEAVGDAPESGKNPTPPAHTPTAPQPT
ncbi:MAG: hypothetical protein JNL76_02085 [Alphaproteobacteria bacterium]|nr:hypothetical protein [Alphaproteobacteria bacterium]